MYPVINFFGLSLETYFLYLSLIFTLIVPFTVYRARKKEVEIDLALDLYLVVICSAFIGARLFYVFYQEPNFYLNNPLEILYFWKGGFVFYGGFFGGFLGGFFLLKKRNLDWKKWANFSAPILSLGYAFGRLSCLLAGCCYGAQTEAWYSIVIKDVSRHPTQIYAFLFELSIFFFLIFLEKKNKSINNLFFIWLGLHGLGRLVMEYFRVDPRGSEILGMSVSSLISLCLILVSLFLVLRNKLFR